MSKQIILIKVNQYSGTILIPRLVVRSDKN
jgi:hypothetical protein